MNIKLKCILLDDELPGLQYLKLICGQVPGLEVVRAFSDPVKCLAEEKALDYDFCILDIDMPSMGGLEVAQLLQPKPVIFTTAHKEYAAEAFDLDAVDYVRKPVTKDRFEKAIRKMAEKLADAPAGDFVRLNTHKGKTLVYFDQLLLVTTAPSDARDKIAHLENGEEILLKNISFTELLDLLPGERFCRVNKSSVLAIKAVDYFSHDEITVKTPGKPLKLTLSDAYRRDFTARTGK